MQNFTKRGVTVNHVDEIWASDLVEMQQFSGWNSGYPYLLMVIDVFSKYGWIRPLKDKGETVAGALKSIFHEGRKPKFLWVDKGREYYNQHVKKLLESEGIHMYSENEQKSSVVERWNRTMKGAEFECLDKYSPSITDQLQQDKTQDSRDDTY